MKKKILIIDDEVGFVSLVKLNLEETGQYEVETENKGAKGLVAAKRFKPDLILLDVIMPDMQGNEVIQQLENNADTKNIPVVFLTAIVTPKETAEEGGIVAGRAFIAKPVSIQKLIEVIKENVG
ncbi:MAG: response regulator [Candidatus Omnitrophota bacterium]